MPKTNEEDVKGNKILGVYQHTDQHDIFQKICPELKVIDKEL
jgi:hypothetical protein